jgi:hypothetical protein
VPAPRADAAAATATAAAAPAADAARGAQAASPEATSTAARPAEPAGAESSFASAVEGADRPRVSIEGPDTAKVGDEIGVSVKLVSPTALGRVRTQVGFDATALQLVSAEPGDLAPPGDPRVDTRPGGVQLEFGGGQGAPVSGSLIDLRFKVVAARPAISIATQVVLVADDGVAVAATQATPLTIAVAK